MIIRTGDASIEVDSLDEGMSVDVSTRMANGRQHEKRLLDLLATRTGKLSDVLEVETELSRERGSGGEIAESFREMWRNFVSFIAGFIALLGFLVPLVVVLGAIWYGLVRISRKMKRPVPGGAAETTS